jgi:hypothetical protein
MQIRRLINNPTHRILCEQNVVNSRIAELDEPTEQPQLSAAGRSGYHLVGGSGAGKSG